jgi:hypothetical protein
MSNAKEKIFQMLDSPDDCIDYDALYKTLVNKSRIAVINGGAEPIEVSVSKTLGDGQDSFFEIPAGEEETWKRHVYRRVNIRLNGGSGIEHVVLATTDCNSFRVRGGEFEYIGPESCL